MWVGVYQGIYKKVALLPSAINDRGLIISLGIEMTVIEENSFFQVPPNIN